MNIKLTTMKHTLLTISLVLSSTLLTAQDYSDAIRINTNTYEGSARSTAMGSAFGALGADLSSPVINPAGLGRYRAGDVSMTLGVNSNNTETSYYGFNVEDDMISVPFNQFGAAFTSRRMVEDKGGLVGMTFVIGYNRLANFHNNATYSDLYGYNSMLDYFCTPEATFNYFSGDLAYEAGMIYDSYINENGEEIEMTHNMWELPFGYGELDLAARSDENNEGLIDHTQHIKNRGSKGEISLAFAWNIANKLYIGTSLGLQTLNYDETKNHKEEYFGIPLDGCTNRFTYVTKLRQDGTGANLKLGVIYQPIPYLSVGFALHTPTIYSINEDFSATITDATNADEYMPTVSGEYEYNYHSPGRMVASLAGFIGQYGIVSFDYERTNYGNSKFKEKDFEADNIYAQTNDDVEKALKSVNILRVGLEAKVNKQLSVRGGYKFTTSPISDNYVYAYDMKYSAISGGLGYRINNFYIDLAYVNSTQEKEHWVLPDTETQYIYEPNEPAHYKSNSHNFILTAGLRF